MNVIIILICVLLIACVILQCCRHNGHIEVLLFIPKVSCTNIGNQLAWLFTGMQRAFAHERDFRVIVGPKRLCKTVVSGFPTLVRYKGSGYDIESGRHVDTLFVKGYTSWTTPLFWNAIRIPAQRLLDDLLPVTDPVDAVLHFRVSDTPFNRHPDYALPMFRWWVVALSYMPLDIDNVVVLWCGSHGNNYGDLPQVYFNGFIAYIRENFPHITFTHRCGSSPGEDMQLMRTCRYLCSSGSSMSVVAAATGHQERAVIIRSNARYARTTSTEWPSHMVELERDVLEHSMVIDYADYAAVHNQLSVRSQ
jgi:hypothetical protein